MIILPPVRRQDTLLAFDIGNSQIILPRGSLASVVRGRIPVVSLVFIGLILAVDVGAERPFTENDFEERMERRDA